jgi:hypothetical protein
MRRSRVANNQRSGCASASAASGGSPRRTTNWDAARRQLGQSPAALAHEVVVAVIGLGVAVHHAKDELIGKTSVLPELRRIPARD